MIKGRLLRTLILLLTLGALVLPANQFAAAQDAESYQAPDQPLITILNTTAETIEINIQFPADPLINNNGTATFDENMYSHPAEVGVPDLPVLRKDIELPFGSNYSLEILDFQSYQVTLGENDIPSIISDTAPEVEKCEPGEDCEPAEDLVPEELVPEQVVTEEVVPEQVVSEEVAIEESITEEVITEEVTIANSTESFPATPVQLLNTYVVRGHQVGQLQFWPVAYDSTNQTAEIYQEITFRITFSEPDMRTTTENSVSYSSYAFENLLASQILNYNQGIQINTVRDTNNEAVLIISPNAFVSALSPLVNLKESQGHPVTLVGLSTTGNTPESIKAYIKYAYQNWSMPPTYVILVGDVNNDANSMPAFTGLSSLTVSDLYYGTVDGSDWIPDIFVGRLPARNTTQLNTMINNLAAYNNLSGTEGWVKKASFLASDDSNYWQVAETTQNYVIQNNTAPASYTGTFPSTTQAGGDKLFAYTYSAGSSNVVNAINSRRALISYTGHGSRLSWGGPNFNQTNIRNITSTGTFSVVTSFACITGDFNATESFGETWLLQPNKGAVAFIGSSSNSFWGPDDILERAMMDSLYSGTESANIVSSFRFAGLMAIEASRPGTGIAQSRYYWESYNLLGDPSLAMMIKPKETDFTLSANPASIGVCQSGENSTAVSIGQINGFNSTVNLSVSASPAGVTSTFSANPVNTPYASTLTFSAGASTAAGQYPLLLSGYSGGLQHDFNLNLAVFSGTPQKVTLTSPAHQQNDAALTQTLTWEENDSNLTYRIQVAVDSSFNQIVIDQTGLTQPSFTPTTPLNNSTTYYWRVRAVNPCGASAFSNTFTFRTLAAPGECPVGTELTPLYQTNFESAPTGWQHYGSNDTWVRNTARSYSPSNAFFSQGKNALSLQHLTSPRIALPQTSGEPVTLKFWQWFEIEAGATTCFDGAMLEISTNNGTSWSQIPNELLLTSPYTSTISTTYNNPLAGKSAWCGGQDWSETVVDLTQYAGQEVILRFTHATDASMGLEGWYVDNFSISACKSLPDYQPQLNTSVVSIGQAPGEEAVIHFELTNAGLNQDTYTLNLATNSWTASIQSQATIQLAPGETTSLEISITVPADAQLGQIEQIIFSVVSINDPKNPPATDSATINLMAAMSSYVPLFNN